MSTANDENTGKYKSAAFDLTMQAAVRQLVFVCDRTGESPAWVISSYDSSLQIDYQSAKDGKIPKKMKNWIASESKLLQTMQSHNDQNMLAESDQIINENENPAHEPNQNEEGST